LLIRQVRASGLCTLLSMCVTHGWDVAHVEYALTDEDRADEGVIAAIGAVYCQGTRSPF
jgi:hypothetical protein